MRKSRTPGSVRGVSGNGYPYRDICEEGRSCFDSQTSPRRSASRYCATPKATSTFTPVTSFQRCAGAASTLPRWRRTPGSHASRRISSIRPRTIANTGCG
ncbi:hypothetical protein GFB98_20795 [Klebsiella pneumoniae]|nr:hypothetical protein [Klebsiella pneumoniae]